MGENIYLYMVIALALLAVLDLVVGVSNDAVNFLNSALGSKAVSLRTILIVASIGIAFGAISSSGMMEVARKGIFNPSEFVFGEIIIVFMAVMITDVILLDFFNSIGMPTSTTVSIVFELLGAAVAMALIKIVAVDESILTLGTYINTEKATEIILGILLSVVIAFTIGAIVQFVSRLLISFNFDERPRWTGAVFGGFAITAIVYFILVKGLKDTLLFGGSLNAFVTEQRTLFLLGNLVFWSLVSRVITDVLKQNIYRLIIVLGTFALAMAFAGNDLVNFIGVPIAALQSFQEWQASGSSAMDYSMEGLALAVQTPTILLLLSGFIMILTLWLSTKALYVTETEINLAREGEGKERFNPNFLSRRIVRLSIQTYNTVNILLPLGLRRRIDRRFEKSVTLQLKDRKKDKPAFDMVRASVNLMVASVLISVATSMKLPLSTTYVTFMVAMGTSLADRAWGTESAVYRVAGVLNVIGGWFLTAIIAFVVSGLIATIIYYGGTLALGLLLFAAILALIFSFIRHRKKRAEMIIEDTLKRNESSSIQGVIVESADNIASVVRRSNKIFSNTIEGLARHDIEILKKNRKQARKLSSEIDDLKDHIYYFIKNLEEGNERATNFYLSTLDYLQDIAQSLEYIIRISFKHLNNNHKKLKYSQIKELKEIDSELDILLEKTKMAFENKSFDEIAKVLQNKEEILEMVSEKINSQISRTRKEETSPKNTTLYFNLLNETKDLIGSTMNLLEMYYSDFDARVEPAAVEDN